MQGITNAMHLAAFYLGQMKLESIGSPIPGKEVNGMLIIDDQTQAKPITQNTTIPKKAVCEIWTADLNVDTEKGSKIKSRNMKNNTGCVVSVQNHFH